jgi:arylsulfatase A-like enzyme
MRLRPLLPYFAGTLAGSAVWAGLEVLWLVGRPFVPLEVLRRQLLLPPRELAALVGIALATSLALGALLGALGAAAAHRRLTRSAPPSAFAAGVLVGVLPQATLAAFVWVNLLADGSFLDPLTLGAFVLATLLLAALTSSSTWLLVRICAQVRAALLVCAGVSIMLLLASASLHSRLAYPPILERGEAAPGLPNIVFVSLDTLRADHVGVYSDGRVRTPLLDRLAAEGVRFNRAISQVPTTTPSHVSMFTSLYPFAHGAKNGVPMRPELVTLPQILRGLGYQTAAFAAAYTTKSNVTGLASGFDTYVDSLNPWIPFLSRDDVEPLAFYRALDRLAGNEIPAAVVNRRITSWLADEPTPPLFLWVHYFDPHLPYEPPPAYRDLYTDASDSEIERNLALYAGEVTHTDAQLAELFEVLEEQGVLRNAIVVVTSDHGEAFGEPHPHLNFGHGKYLYDSALWVPLIFWGPGKIPAGRVVEGVVQSIDLAPTLLELLGVSAPESFEGRSLASTFATNAGDEAAFSQTASFYGPRFAVRSGPHKLIVSPEDDEEELFDLTADPGETTNVIAEHPEIAERLRHQLWSTLEQANDTSAELDAETRERLRAMGYLDD